ncbi:RING-1 like protein [Emericellopsis atlantica]|uniref:RING-type E3 ubiquitin transferase n=1 Tax=Emericellopsis atlantica TaxID=2614577 RepID=A0A9P7ZUF6_9HYPO|nr:RING-1 like protein [Emericellopsis atlantica]KAG9257838.1 RING-1 like protein [Emericellopsis atlantica]
MASPFPFAAAPDIIRSHQKDAYFTGHLTNTLTDLHRRLLGARSAHALAPELRTVATLLYFALTTLPGNRTLGEEYCDLVQLEGNNGKLPSLRRRAGYIVASILVPYGVSRALPGLRTRLRRVLEARLAVQRQKDPKSRQARILEYILRHLPSLTPSAPLHALTLAVFYFSGTYYELSKRLLNLRYVFTRKVPDSPDRAGYEVLGVLLVIQMAVQGYLHVRSTLQAQEPARERVGFEAAAADVSLDHDNSYSANNALLPGSGGIGTGQGMKVDIAAATHTPVGTVPRIALTDDKMMAYIKGKQQRKCTLCLEELKDPAATQCGHVFCWECIGDWVREKPECPLCRRDALVQHILPLRVI